MPKANLATSSWDVLRRAYGLDGDLTGGEAKTLVRRLFHVVLAVRHAPQFELDHQESLAQDWMHLPIPKDPALLAELADMGDQIAVLLDPLSNAHPILHRILGDSLRSLAVLQTTDIRPDYTITYSYFAGAKGRWDSRTVSAGSWPTEWGESTGDLYLNPTTFLRNVPERIWRYELGGYAVVKKWLGYRDVKRRPGKPLTLNELDHLQGIVRRLSALHLLHPQLDVLYDRLGDNVFTVEELGLQQA